MAAGKSFFATLNPKQRAAIQKKAAAARWARRRAPAKPGKRAAGKAAGKAAARGARKPSVWTAAKRREQGRRIKAALAARRRGRAAQTTVWAVGGGGGGSGGSTNAAGGPRVAWGAIDEKRSIPILSGDGIRAAARTARDGAAAIEALVSALALLADGKAVIR